MKSQSLPNILFLLVDQWRRDACGFRNHPLARTPNLDQLAASGVFFENAFSPTPLCSPARGCLLTGRWPHQSGVEDNIGVGASIQEPLAATMPTWLESARAGGWRVGYFGKWHLGADGPIQRGVDCCSRDGFERHHPAPGKGIPRATEVGVLKPEYAQPPPRNGNWPPFYEHIEGSVSDTRTGRTAAEAIAFLRDDAAVARPWFLTASFHGPHFPHSLPEPFAGRIDPAAVDLPASLRDPRAGKPWFQGGHWWTCHDTSAFTEDEWRKTAAAYYGMIAMIDHEIGRILNAAQAASGGRPTWIVFASDHGEMLGAHGLFDKGPYFYDETMRIPLLICPPADDTAPRRPAGPRVRGEHVNLLDLGATLFDLTGAKPSVAGRSLLPLLSGADDGRDWPARAHFWMNRYNGHSFILRGVRTPDRKFSFNPQAQDECYDLAADPGEMNNLAPCADGEALKRELFEWLRREDDPLLRSLGHLPRAGSYAAKE